MKKRIISIILLFLIVFNVSVYGLSFNDISENDWFYNDVMTLREQGVISGYSDDTFRPSANIKNAEALKMIMGVADITPYPAISGAHWASGYLKKAKELKIVSDSINKDTLDNSITRQDVADIVVKALKLDKKDLTLNLDTFIDTKDKNVNILSTIGVINGIKGSDGWYTSTYNYMCKLLGIEVEGIVGSVKSDNDHMWTLATFDGEKVHIDTTWGDSYADDVTPNYSYFGASSSFMKKSRTWDSAAYDI